MYPFLPLQQVDPYTVQQSVGSGGRAIGAFLGTLVVGGLLLVFLEDAFERVVGVVETEPVSSFFWGLGFLIALVVVVVVLVVTIVGILIAVPLVIVALLVDFAGSAAVYVSVGSRIAEAADWKASRWGHLLVGAVVAGLVAALPVVGGLVSFVVGGIGVGAIARDWYRRHEGA